MIFLQFFFFLVQLFKIYFFLFCIIIANSFDENSNFNSDNVSEELSHPIKGFLVGSLVINSNIHLSFFASTRLHWIFIWYINYSFIHNDGRSGRIRTCDPLVPNQMRYQAALHSDPCTNTAVIDNLKV